jgi:cytochrome c oxidase assembly protein subunit 11
MTTDQKTTGTALKLFAFTIVMFGFGYALVPLYDVFCEITGLNGKTGIISQEKAGTISIDEDRLVTVQFDTNINGDLPWAFKSSKNKVQVHPGQITDVLFVVENQADIPVIGQAIPSVAPGQASLHFNKTECFCFTQQTLGPHERKEMLVRFVVDPALPRKISTVTLSYTFFMMPDANVSADKTEQTSVIIKQTNI